jgi:hypothetical protein
MSKDNPPVPLDANQKKLLSEMMRMALDLYIATPSSSSNPVKAAEEVNMIFQYLLKHCFNKAVVDRPDNAPESTV